MTNKKQVNDTNNKNTNNKNYLNRMIKMVSKDIASRPAEWSYEELVELDSRLSEDSDF